MGGITWPYYCRTMRSRGELWLVAIVLCLTMWSGPWLCLTLCCVMEDKVPTGGCLPTVFLGTRRLQSTNDASISWLNLLPHVSVVIMRLLECLSHCFTNATYSSCLDVGLKYYLSPSSNSSQLWFMDHVFHIQQFFNRLHSHNIIQWLWKTVVWPWVFSPWSWSDANPLFIGLCFWFGFLLTIFHIIFTYILKIQFECGNIREIFHGLMSPNYHIKMSAKMISLASSSTFSKFPTRTKTSSWDIRDVIATIYATKLQGSKRHFTQELENSWPMICKLCDWSWS